MYNTRFKKIYINFIVLYSTVLVFQQISGLFVLESMALDIRAQYSTESSLNSCVR